MPTPQLSQRTVDLTIACEVSSRAYFEKKLARPEWPGGRSGDTWGIGYDGGYTNNVKLQRDWGPLVPGPMLAAMRRAIGVTGQAAKELLPEIRPKILLTWDQATAVFFERDIPEYMGEIFRAIPGSEKLSPDCQGILFSIGYNRGNGGWTSTSDRFKEMHDIRAHIMDGKLYKVSADIRAMKRCWPDPNPHSVDAGLRKRRDREADLWEEGLKNPAPAAARHVATENPKQLPPRPATVKEHGSAAGTVIAAGSAANDASNAGASSVEVAAIVIGGIILAAVIWYCVRVYRAKQYPVLANSKERAPVEPAPVGKPATV